jgi:hypothetical protein
VPALTAQLEFPPVATLLADQASAPSAEHPPPVPPGADPESAQAPGPPAAGERPCVNCGSQMGPGQDWCLQCGAGAPGSLAAPAASWRSGATVLAAAAILALGAAAAAVAALSKGKARPHVLTTMVARAPAAVTPGPAAVPGAATPATPVNPAATTLGPAVRGAVKPPKIPLTAPTPKPAVTPTTPSNGGGTPTTTPTNPSPNGETPAQGESQPGAILLDTNAAQTYNPYAYPATIFGDPSLTIDGDTTTGWTAQVDPAVAPKMAEGIVIDLKSPRKLSALELITTTPGMTIQVYGANSPTLPNSITDHAWVKLTPNLVEKSRHVRLTFRGPRKAVRFVTLWISRAPASSVGTPQAPGHVSLNEIELFPG